jgi:cell division protein FtsW
VPIRQRFDRLLLGAAILQTGVGLALLASASWLLATERYGRPGSYFFTWQAATALVGLGVLVVCMHLRSDLLTEPRLARFAIGLSWLLLAAAYLQPPVAATHRWISIGGFSLQPSVLARVALTIFAAVELDRARREGWPNARLWNLAGVCAITSLLIIAAPAAFGVAALAVAVVTSPYRLARVRAFFDPDAATAAGWQSYQSLVAIGSGGLTGRGYGSGLQKLFFLPEPHTDFIFSITGEELGLIGLLGLVGLISLITWRGMRIAARLVNTDRALLAFGLTFAFAVQSLIHMVVCLDLLPPKGIPLPLVSYGKTDLVVTLASIGLLLNLSREASV